MNIKGMIQKAKEKLFGKKQEEKPQKAYQKEFAEVIAEGTIAAAGTEKPDGSRTVYQELEESMKVIVDAFGVLVNRISELAQIFRPMEPWEKEKLKMPNNERRRRKIPMVRSRAYIQARKNSRKRKKKKG